MAGATEVRGARYAIAPMLCVRTAGVPFGALASLGSPAVAEAARALLAAETAVDRAAADAIERARHVLSVEQRPLRRALKVIVQARRAVGAEHLAAHPWLADYARAADAYAQLAVDLERVIDREALRVHHNVREHALAVLPDFALIESPAMLEELSAIAKAPPVTTLRASDRETDRALAMYLQRVCAKGDTISRFGPTGWGRIVDGNAWRMRVTPGITARCVEVERWVIAEVIAKINLDPDLRAELCPRRHPDAMIDDRVVTRLDLSASQELTPAEGELLAKCDGHTPAHRLGDLAVLATLFDKGAVIWELERYAVDASPLASLVADVTGWRESAARTRWLAQLSRLSELANAFGLATVAERRALITSFMSELTGIGIAPRERGRSLYAAANPISENCAREYAIELGATAIARLVDDVSPWFDLYGDAYALAAGRVFERYRELVLEAPRRRGRTSYAELVLHARARGIEIDNDSLHVQVGRETFAELKQLFGQALEARAHADEIELTAEDCHVLRRRYAIPTGHELVWPSADLQIAAAAPGDVAAGRYTWILAELHHGITPLQHAVYWSCPDKPALHAAIDAMLAHQPYAVRGASTEQPVHNAAEALFAAVPHATFVGRGRPKPGWRAVAPVDAEVVVDEAGRDVRLRSPAGADLGSLVRAFRMMMGMHPFFPFERMPHAARLRLGKTIVQRRMWHLTSDEVGEPRPPGVSAAFVVGIERMRRERSVPRWVFARPTGHGGARLRPDQPLGRDKDVKPFYCDLESVLGLDILERRLRKYGELLLSEMLPSPDQLGVWDDVAGGTVFELRTSVVPA